MAFKGTFSSMPLPDLLQWLASGRKTGRLVGVKEDTVIRYARLAGAHARSLHDEMVAFSPFG